MRRSIDTLLVCGLLALPALPAAAQSPPNPAMTAPDQVAWQLFIQANTRAGGSNSTFETWASDTDLFQPNPQFPAAPTPPSLRPPILPQVAREGVQESGGLLPALPPGAAQGQMEETRHNKPTFDFIVQNNLYKLSGVKAAFGKALSFPVDSVEVKGNWLAVSDIPQFTNNKVTLAQVPQLYHVNSAAGVQYALVSMHVISKQVPNWTWATFEHRFNPGRCDIIGCRDNFGAQTAFVPSNRTAGQGYPDCVKTTALTAMLSSADIDPVYNNYCLKGSQVDFVDNVGLDIRVGNSVTEDGFVATSSCITCHGRAAFKAVVAGGIPVVWFEWPGRSARAAAAGMVLEVLGPAADLRRQARSHPHRDRSGLRVVDPVLRLRRYANTGAAKPMRRKVRPH